MQLHTFNSTSNIYVDYYVDTTRHDDYKPLYSFIRKKVLKNMKFTTDKQELKLYNSASILMYNILLLGNFSSSENGELVNRGVVKKTEFLLNK